MRGTQIAVCSRNRSLPDALSGLEVDIVASAFVQASVGTTTRRAVSFERRGVVFRTAHVLAGWLGRLPRGTYEWTFELAPEEPVRLDGPELAAIEVVHGNTQIAAAAVPGGAHELVVRFDAPGDEELVTYRFRSQAATPLVVQRARLRRVTGP